MVLAVFIYQSMNGEFSDHPENWEIVAEKAGDFGMDLIKAMTMG